MTEKSSKIKTIIIDNEPQCILSLQNDLMALDDFEVVATSAQATSAQALVTALLPDVLFIDVEMPGLTGFEVVQSLQAEVTKNLIIVFYSAFDKYMIDALRASAFDFLLKPYQREEFDIVIERIRQKLSDTGEPATTRTDNDTALPDLSDLTSLTGNAPKRAAIQTISGLLMVKPEEVFCFSYDEELHLWSLRMTNGQGYKLKKQVNAKSILSISSSFVQVRQDCIINLDYLISIENYTLRCIFAPPFDKEDITISRRCYKAVKERLEIL